MGIEQLDEFFETFQHEYQNLSEINSIHKHEIEKLFGVTFNSNLYYNGTYIVSSNKTDIEMLSFLLKDKGFALYHYESNFYLASFRYSSHKFLTEILPKPKHQNVLILD